MPHFLVVLMGGRKFIFALLCFLGPTIALFTKFMEAGTYSTVVMSLAGIYLGSNVADGIMEKWQSKPSADSLPSQP